MKKLEKLKNITALTDGKIYDPYAGKNISGNLLLKNGFIEKIGSFEIPSGADILDCKNKMITCGFTDIHAHFREPGREDKETLETGCLAALAGGFTSVCVMPNTDPPLDNPESIRFIIEKSASLPINIYPIGAITKGQKGTELAEISEMYNSGVVAISDDGIPLMNGNVMRYAVEYCKMLDIPVINHAEDDFLRSSGLMNESKLSTKLGLTGNPAIAESTMVYRDLAIAEYTGGKVHIPHVSSAQTVELIKEFKNRGVTVTSEVTPHHLGCTEELLQEYDTNGKVAPPIRSEMDRIALVKGLQEGIIDCIATDHAPHTIEEKEADFELASCGMIGLESAFGLSHTVLKNAGSSTEDVINWLTVKPSNIMGLENEGIVKGKKAELTIVDPEKTWEFNETDIYSKSGNTPFIGRKFDGYIDMVISGNTIFRKNN